MELNLAVLIGALTSSAVCMAIFLTALEMFDEFSLYVLAKKKAYLPLFCAEVGLLLQPLLCVPLFCINL